MKPIASHTVFAITTILSRHVLGQDDLSFTGDNETGCKIIPLGSAGSVLCRSASNQDVTWWHDGTRVSEYAPGKPVQQLDGGLYFYNFATKEDSGDYYCKSQNDEKLLKVYIVENTTVDFCAANSLETVTHPTTAISTAADDISFSGEDDGGCKIVALGDSGHNTQCLSASHQHVAWWHDDTRVSEYNSGESVRQLEGRIYFYYFATVDDSGDYYCKSDSDEKLLQVYIVNVTETSTEELCTNDADTSTGATTAIWTHAETGGTLGNSKEEFNIVVLIAIPVTLILVIVPLSLLVAWCLSLRRKTHEQTSDRSCSRMVDTHDCDYEYPSNNECMRYETSLQTDCKQGAYDNPTNTLAEAAHYEDMHVLKEGSPEGSEQVTDGRRKTDTGIPDATAAYAEYEKPELHVYMGIDTGVYADSD